MVNIGILALQGDVAEHVRALEESGARAVLVRRSEELASVDGLVIPGGESTTMSNLLLSFGIFDQLAEQISNGMPVYGTCAGMIMLATSILDGRDDQRSFGAIDMVVRRNAFGRQVDSYEEDLDIKGIEGKPFPAVFIRAPWVESVGESVDVLARAGNTPDGPIVAVRSGQALATSFHPEIGTDWRFHELFTRMVQRESQSCEFWESTRVLHAVAWALLTWIPLGVHRGFLSELPGLQPNLPSIFG